MYFDLVHPPPQSQHNTTTLYLCNQTSDGNCPLVHDMLGEQDPTLHTLQRVIQFTFVEPLDSLSSITYMLRMQSALGESSKHSTRDGLIRILTSCTGEDALWPVPTRLEELPSLSVKSNYM